ncbi:MAG: hypothetical protein RJA22_606 [Verrucomicrobiota bacterium]
MKRFAALPRSRVLRADLLKWVRVAACAAAAAVPCVAHGAPATGTDPAAELASFKLAPGFQANLFASEADGVVKPIQSRFDARGRLWVIGSTVYPQLEPGQVPDDKVWILEDTDGDGRADRTTVFAGGLFIPTGLEIGDGGCYVGNSTELLHLRDTDGDGRADERRVVLRGFGTGDNHQNINSFQWSPGGELWFSQGLHAHSRVETPWGVETLDHAGIWRWRPRRLELTPFFGGELPPHNPWGFVFDDWHRMLLLAGNGHGIHDPLPILMRGHRLTPLDQVWKDYRGRKLCGGDLVGNAHFPDDWQGVLVAGGFINNAIYALRVAEVGAGLAVTDREPLLTSTHNSFRPVDVKFGPDGALYVTDWFNPIIGHYQASFRHPDRDKRHGRIWRITAKDRPLVRQPELAGASIDRLLEHLKATDRFTRLQARRQLAERETPAVTRAVRAWLARLDAGDERRVHHELEALGVLESHEAVEPSLLRRLLEAGDARARAAAVGAVGRWQDRLPDPLGLLRRTAADPHPRVRLATVVAAAAVPRPESVAVALSVTDHPVDQWIDYALRQAVFVLKPHWLAGFRRGDLDLGAPAAPARLEFLVKADGSPDTLQALRQLTASPDLPGARREAFLSLLAAVGDTNDLARLLDPATFSRGPAYDAAGHARVLAALENAARVRATRPAGPLGAALQRLLAPAGPREVRLSALRLAGLWRVRDLGETARALTLAPAVDDEVRKAGAVAWAAIEGTNAVAALGALGEPGRPRADQVAAVLGLAALDPTAAAPVAARLLAADAEGTTVPVLLPALATRRGGAAALAAALRMTAPAPDAARLALRWLQGTGWEDAGLAAVLASAAGLGGEPLRATPAVVAELVAEVRASGDARRGEAVFRRPDLSCLACHAVGGRGGQSGPPLDSVGAGQPLDFIIGAVLEPNREVKESYEAIEVTTRDGEVHTGYRVRADNRELVLRDGASAREVRLRRDQIVAERVRGSIMPAGLVDHLTRAERRDLFRYLSELGRAGR